LCMLKLSVQMCHSSFSAIRKEEVILTLLWISHRSHVPNTWSFVALVNWYLFVITVFPFIPSSRGTIWHAWRWPV
jgi:hypothetical protein